jgi:hypothetical protein
MVAEFRSAPEGSFFGLDVVELLFALYQSYEFSLARASIYYMYRESSSDLPDCICSYDASMATNLRMHRASKFDKKISYLIAIARAWNLGDLRLYRILHLSELCGALTLYGTAPLPANST